MSDPQSTPAQPSDPPLATKDKVLETSASVVQDFKPVSQICAHLNAFHVYASDPARCVEANHYCTHLNQDVRQCIIYDSPEKGARLIGVEYMVTKKVYETLPPEERKLWHSHAYEVKSGMLIMPLPASAPIPTPAWEKAETGEMGEVIGLYGKTYHFWQVDRGDVVPLGHPELMVSFTGEAEVNSEAKGKWKERDERFGVDSGGKAEKRGGIETPEIHPDADRTLKERRQGNY